MKLADNRKMIKIISMSILGLLAVLTFALIPYSYTHLPLPTN